MATYKVLQDIEAEDKLLGPLTLKQFIFAAIFVGLAFIQFTIVTSGAPDLLKVPFVVVILPFMLIFGFLAAPISRDQPNDLWLLARLRYLFKPRTRIWNQDGINQLVTITAPKRVIHSYTDGLDQGEVKSRLQALASTMDSRGWAVKNVNTNMFAQPSYLTDDSGSDRLVAASTLPQTNIAPDVDASDDMLDVANNQIAQHFDNLVKESNQSRKNQAIESMKGKPTPEKQAQDYWFMNQQTGQPAAVPSDYATFTNQPVVQPGTDDHAKIEETEEEKDFAKKLIEQHKNEAEHVSDHMKTIQPLHDREGNIVKQNTQLAAVSATDNAAPAVAAPTSPKPQQNQPNPAIIELANNDDLNIATIARQANLPKEGGDEVVISLH